MDRLEEWCDRDGGDHRTTAMFFRVIRDAQQKRRSDRATADETRPARPAPSEPGRLLSVEQAASALSISPYTLRRHIKDRTIPVTRLGRRTLITTEEIERIRRVGLPSLQHGRRWRERRRRA